MSATSSIEEIAARDTGSQEFIDDVFQNATSITPEVRQEAENKFAFSWERRLPRTCSGTCPV
ncbi:MAG: hypothetical protein LBR38_07530 [Synergistaceae bacterium]|nr:hypothetical protein [Synergistaceae bacterium]